MNILSGFTGHVSKLVRLCVRLHREVNSMITIGVLTISDSVSKGQREDLSGAAICSLVAQLPNAIVSVEATIADEQDQIAVLLRMWSDEQLLNLILTTGGTG